VPALGKPARALERRAAAVAIHQVHRLTRAVAGVDSGQPAAGALLERGLPAGRGRGPELGNIALRDARPAFNIAPARPMASCGRTRLSPGGLTANEGNRDMSHRRIGLGAVPMAFAGLDLHDVTDVDLALFMLGCHHAGARGHD
jgi:hypothetical protein